MSACVSFIDTHT